ncbi:hypothetical protein SPSIL_050100 [Sporomusa silvacetica DSM 10669]|uniref:Uncharacterized protein n=1 Tax=Sporomusa silvacetica DSM 10669 TaxID=1123289 RepID=A0ABZ3ISU1_9FIRM
MIHIVKESFDVRIHYMADLLAFEDLGDFLQRFMATSSWSETVGAV